MPIWCSVSFCGNRSDKTCNVSYHKFPKNEKEKKLWIQFCEKRSEWFPSPTTRICSSHFKNLDFERNFRSELMGGVSRRILKRGAVPSIINESEEELSQVDERKENQGIIENIFENIDKEEKERQYLLKEMLEIAEEEEEQIPSTYFDGRGSPMITQSPEELNLDYKTLYSIILEENNDLQTKNSILRSEIRQTRQKLRILVKRCKSYRIKLLERQIDLLLRKKKRVK